MLGITHVLFAAIFAFLLLRIFSFSHPIHFFLLFCFAALLPDLDHPGSVLGRKVWPLSGIISFFFGHRGLFHSFFIPAGFLFFGWYFQVLWIGFALAGGYITHLAADMLTPGGVKPFWFGPKVRGIIRTGAFLEVLFFILMFIFFVGLFLETL